MSDIKVNRSVITTLRYKGYNFSVLMNTKSDFMGLKLEKKLGKKKFSRTLTFGLSKNLDELIEWFNIDNNKINND